VLHWGLIEMQKCSRYRYERASIAFIVQDGLINAATAIDIYTNLENDVSISFLIIDALMRLLRASPSAK